MSATGYAQRIVYNMPGCSDARPRFPGMFRRLLAPLIEHAARQDPGDQPALAIACHMVSAVTVRPRTAISRGAGTTRGPGEVQDGWASIVR